MLLDFLEMGVALVTKCTKKETDLRNKTKVQVISFTERLVLMVARWSASVMKVSMVYSYEILKKYWLGL